MDDESNDALEDFSVPEVRYKPRIVQIGDEEFYEYKVPAPRGLSKIYPDCTRYARVRPAPKPGEGYVRYDRGVMFKHWEDK